MTNLATAGRALRASVGEPPELGTVRRRVRQRRRQRAIRWTASASLLAALILIASGHLDRARTTDQFVRLHVATADVNAPPRSGRRLVDYGDLRVEIPSTWIVIGAGSSSSINCPVRGALLLGNATVTFHGCQPSDVPTVRMTTSVEPRDAAGRVSRRGSMTAIRTFDSRTLIGYTIPGLHADLSFAGGAEPGPILRTARPSARWVALGLTGRKSPKRWQQVTFGGVTIRVPRAWPIVDVRHDRSFGCGMPTPPAVELGGRTSPKCPYIPPQPPRDGLQLRTATASELPAGTMTRPVASLMVHIDPDASAPVLNAWIELPNGELLALRLGLGSDGTVAGRILGSIRASR
jgi:hypothetical protein